MKSADSFHRQMPCGRVGCANSPTAAGDYS